MSNITTVLAPRREIFAWAMFDFANSGYTTVVLTAIFNAYFVSVIAAESGSGNATLLWTIAIASANGLVLLSAPMIGAIADYSGAKKRFLFVSTVACVTFTSLLAFTGPGDIALAMVLVILSSMAFFSGENLVAAFLPEISPQNHMGRISAYGWTLGYVGGLLVLGLCLAYVSFAEAAGHSAQDYVPVTLLIVAACFGLASLPTFLVLKERATARTRPAGQSYLAIGFGRLRHTWQHARRYQDLFHFLLALTVFQCGINTVVILAAVYAQEVMGFTTRDTITLILVVNITAAIGAHVFGRLQDSLGSRRILILTLLVWLGASLLAFFATDRLTFWLVANLVGIALGSSQSASRALVGLFSPPRHSGEFFGLWGLATKLAAIIGPLSYGFITWASHGNQRLALLSTSLFFVLGLLLLLRVDEQRGIAAARA